MLIYTAEVTVHNGTGTETLYLSSHPFITNGTDSPVHTAFDVRLIDPILIKLSAYENITGGGSSTGGGEIVVANADNFYGYLANYGFDGRQVIVRVGEQGSAYPSAFTTILNGTMIAPKFDKTRFTIRLKDKLELLNKPLLTTTYLGNNALPDGLEGVSTDIKGQVKPRVYGSVFNIEPKYVNTSKLIYQVSDGEISSVGAVYDKGATLTKESNYTSQVDMETNPPSSGCFRVWPSGGYFRLVSSPVGTVTCDVVQGAATTDRTVAQILSSIGSSMGIIVSSTDVTTLDVINSSEVGIYITDSTNAITVMDDLSLSIGAWFSFDELGVLRCGRLEEPLGTPDLYIDDNVLVKCDLVSNADTVNGVPAFKTTVNYKKFYTIQSSDLAGSVNDARRGELLHEYRSTISYDNNVKIKHLLSDELTFTTLLVNANDAQTEADRLLALHKVRRDRVSVRVRLDMETLASLKIMSIARITTNSFDYYSGRDFRILGYTIDSKSMVADLVLWGDMANIMVGFNNLANLSTLSGGSWISSLPLNNLKDRRLYKVARTTDTSITSTKFIVDMATDKLVKIFSIVKHNFSTDATARLVASNDNSFSTLLYDSGFSSVWPLANSTVLDWEETNYWSGLPSAEQINMFQGITLWVIPSITARYWRVEISDPYNTEGHIDVGRLFISKGFSPTVNSSYGLNFNVNDKSTIEESFGGVEFYDEKRKFRSVDFNLAHLTEDEAFGNWYRLMLGQGTTGELLFIYDHENMNYSLDRSFLGRLDKLSPLNTPYHDNWSSGVSITETI